MLVSATSSSIVGPRLVHSARRCARTRQPSAMTSRPSSSDVGDTVGNLVERRMAINLVQRWLEQLALVGGITRDDRGARHHPDAHALAPTGVDVARVLDRHLG